MTTDQNQGFKDVDIAILVAGSFPKSSMDQREVMSKNVKIYKKHARAISDYASRRVKVRLNY